jgi:4-hydroxy-tetrahydrodipicolinate synthase
MYNPARHASLAGNIPTIVTPMRNGGVDHDSLQSLLAYINPHVDGYLTCGSVGEGASLTLDERIDVMETIARFREGDETKGTWFFGTSGTALPEIESIVEACVDCGVDALLTPQPSYFAISPPMPQHFYAAVAAMSELPIVIYDNPYPTNYFLVTDEIINLVADNPTIIGVKVTDPNVQKVSALKAQSKMLVFTGDDFICWRMLCRGADGAMLAYPMILPETFARMYKLHKAGCREEAFVLWSREILPFANECLRDTDYVQTSKGALHRLGVIASPEMRLPLTPLDLTRRQEVAEALAIIPEARKQTEGCRN